MLPSFGYLTDDPVHNDRPPRTRGIAGETAAAPEVATGAAITADDADRIANLAAERVMASLVRAGVIQFLMELAPSVRS